jgi:hypothetical protein
MGKSSELTGIIWRKPEDLPPYLLATNDFI